MAIKQISVFIENRLGRLYEITSVLEKEGIDIRALSIADTTDYGILRLIVSDPDRALRAFKARGLTASATEVLGVEIEDVPGGFSRAVKALSDGGVGIEYAYAFITPKVGAACVIIRVADNGAAAAILEKAGIALIPQEKAFSK